MTIRYRVRETEAGNIFATIEENGVALDTLEAPTKVDAFKAKEAAENAGVRSFSELKPPEAPANPAPTAEEIAAADEAKVAETQVKAEPEGPAGTEAPVTAAPAEQPAEAAAPVAEAPAAEAAAPAETPAEAIPTEGTTAPRKRTAR